MKHLLILTLVAIAVAVAVSDYMACKEVGGVLVRGLFWFECVGAKP